MVSIDAVILAAGLSRRMGVNKLLLPLGGSTIIRCFLDIFPYELFRDVILVYSSERVKAAVADLPVTFCRNDNPKGGKSYSIKKGLASSDGADGFMFLVADQPLLSRSTLDLLVSTFSRDCRFIVAPKVNNQHANPVIFPSFFRHDLMALRNDNGGRIIIENHPERVRHVAVHSADEFLDIDTPQDYQELVSRWN